MITFVVTLTADILLDRIQKSLHAFHYVNLLIIGLSLSPITAFENIT